MATYRNQVRRAAIDILEVIIKTPKWGKVKIVNPDKGEEKLKEILYKQYSLQGVKKEIGYQNTVLLDAAFLLKNNNHIDILKNENDEYDIGIIAFKSGEIALRERFYQDDISNYNSDKYYSYFRWVLPIMAILISIVSLYFSIKKQC